MSASRARADIAPTCGMRHLGRLPALVQRRRPWGSSPSPDRSPPPSRRRTLAGSARQGMQSSPSAAAAALQEGG
eukprot:3322407-Prymnesium_polylepis.1